jgi:hypothetical protein
VVGNNGRGELGQCRWIVKVSFRKIQTFGSVFYDSLAQWSRANIEAILMTEQIVNHSNKFDLALPEKLVPPENRRPVDEHARWDMMVKLVELKMHDIGEFRRLLDQPNSAELEQSALDTGSRYVTSSARDLERATAWYRYLKENGF